MLHGQIIEFIQYLLRGHAGSEIVQYIVNRDPKIPDARLVTPFVRFDGDNFSKVHIVLICTKKRRKVYCLKPSRMQGVLCATYHEVAEPSLMYS